jgi:hypothetical protein
MSNHAHNTPAKFPMPAVHVRRTVAQDHKVVLVEGGAEDPNHPDAERMPHYWQVYCSCSGTVPIARSYHGEAYAREAAERHVWTALTGKELTPGGAEAGRFWDDMRARMGR